ncbi:translocation protein TolB [Streptomyces cyanogenus]|uniref:Translocation protein TolB n=2 Tax=Streptomyces cyanogenus TaxID=80860 RepID=A0ABX7U591_STRCY|nr:WD40 repeat domain-containing protein [Streptomyces cyanogenus]QTE03007.1 translocation protein TolB [Streptomyces cyanogenus]
MAQRTGQGASTLSQAAAGERLPTLPVLLAYVHACGGDPEEWEERWREASAEAAAKPRTEDEDAEPPYRGLARFEPGDADLFFGRGQLTDRLLELTRSRRFTAVFGPSGSGKSSLLRAGLIPRLRIPEVAGPQPAAVRILTPGEHPLRVHERRLTPEDAGGDTWLIVDQFEELYTLCTDPAERNQFIDRLLAATDPASRLRVVIAVRADFLGRCAEHPALTAALQDETVLVGPMSRDELREAITKPAQAAGMIVERGLTARIIEEVEDEPGALPLMSHALLETWRRRKGRALTIEAYQAAGGLSGALARTAEDVHSRLTPSQADLARRVMLRLITPGEGTPDTRRPAPRTELDLGDPDDTDEVLEHLARARLLTLEQDTVDLTHEALIAAWPRLQAWINEARDRLRLHRQLTEAARTWDDLDRDPGALLRGTRLTAAEETFLLTDAESDLTAVEREFLTLSITGRRREQEAAGRTTRRLRQFTLALSVLLVLALAAGLIAWQQYGVSEQQRQQALTAQRVAVSRQLAAESDGLIGANPDLASLLAVQAYRASPTREATASLFAAAMLPLQHRLTGHTGSVESVAFSPDGHTLASGGVDGVRLWDTATGKARAILKTSGSVESVAFSPDGHTLASGESEGKGQPFDGEVLLWDTATGKPRTALKTPSAVESVAFSRDGHTLASGGVDARVRLWDTATGKLRTTLEGHTHTVESVAFSPDGHTLASSESGGKGEQSDGKVLLWDAAKGKLRTTLKAHIGGAEAVAFSRDGHTLASGGADAKVRLWDTATGKLRTTLKGHTDTVMGVAFSPDGHTLASGGGDQKVLLWDPATGRLRATLKGHTDIVESVAFSPDGRTLASTGDDKTVRLWDTAPGSPHATLQASGGVQSVAFSPDGRSLASGESDETAGEFDGEIRLWDTATDKLRTTLHGHISAVETVAFSPDGRTLASGGDDYDNAIRLWDMPTGKLRTTLNGHLDTVLSVAFSPDGHTLASSGGDGKVLLWDMTAGKLRTTLSGQSDILEWSAESVAFSPDGNSLAGAADDGKLRLWDTRTGNLRTAIEPEVGRAVSVAFSPDGRILASGWDDEKIRLWDTATGKLRATLNGHTGNIESLVFSPDGHTLASGGDDRTVRLWDIATGGLRTTLNGHTDTVKSLAFSPDGRTLASGGADEKVRLWDVSLSDPLSAMKKISQAVHRSLTQSERSAYLADQPPTD